MAPFLVFLIDAVLVVVFSAFGRGAHSEGLGVAQIWGTAWPFLLALLVGWVAVLAMRRAPTAVSTGVILWLTTLVGGMTVRGLSEGGVPHWSFVLVAGLVTALFLIGWRLLALAVKKRRAHAN